MVRTCLNVFDTPPDCASRVTSVSTSGNAKIHTSEAARLTAALGSAFGGEGGGTAGVAGAAGAAGAAAVFAGAGVSELPHEVKANAQATSAHARRRREEVMASLGRKRSRGGNYGSAIARRR